MEIKNLENIERVAEALTHLQAASGLLAAQSVMHMIDGGTDEAMQATLAEALGKVGDAMNRLKGRSRASIDRELAEELEFEAKHGDRDEDSPSSEWLAARGYAAAAAVAAHHEGAEGDEVSGS